MLNKNDLFSRGGEFMGLSLEDTSFAKFYRKEGLKEGEKKKAIEIATRLLSKGFSIEEVAEDTGLTIEEVKKIQNV